VSHTTTLRIRPTLNVRLALLNFVIRNSGGDLFLIDLDFRATRHLRKSTRIFYYIELFVFFSIYAQTEHHSTRIRLVYESPQPLRSTSEYISMS